jgi:hypothetical protein
MRRGTLLLALFVAAFDAGCSSGGSTTLPPPPPLGFSNASLKGQYAFLMTGQAGDGSFLARIGTFVADGSGGISGGTELVRTASNGLQQLTFSTSNYQVQSDGRGAINLTNLTGTISFSLTLTSTGGGYIAETDGISGASGTFELQDTSAFTTSALSGPFVFDNTGLDGDTQNGPFPDSIVGQIVLNAGTVSSGVYDENDGAVASGPTAITSGTYSISDATNGLGSLFINNTFQYAFVIVNGQKFHMIEIPAQGATVPITIGTANAQSAPPSTTAAFSNAFVFLAAGSGTTSPDFKVGRFTADGNGNLGSIAMDEKLVGSSVTQIPKGTLSAMTYTVDPNFSGSGRVAISFLDSSNNQPYQFIAYMASATQGFVQDNSPGIVGDGQILAQTGAPFSNGSVAADYGFNWSGVSTNNTTGVTAEEDFVGHVTVSSATSSNVTGAMDFSELNSNQGAFHDSALNGTLTINGDGTTSSGNRSTLKVTAAGTNGGPSSTFNFSLYPVNASTMFVVSTDTDQSTGGAFTKQITPP